MSLSDWYREQYNKSEAVLLALARFRGQVQALLEMSPVGAGNEYGTRIGSRKALQGIQRAEKELQAAIDALAAPTAKIPVNNPTPEQAVDQVHAAGEQLAAMRAGAAAAGVDLGPAGGRSGDACGCCGLPFDPADTSWDGRARHGDFPWCRACVDRCHEASELDHTCVICVKGSA